MEWLSTTTVLSEASARCQQWLNSIIADDGAAGAEDRGSSVKQPWEGVSPDFREALRARILQLSQDKNIFLHDTPTSAAATVSAEQAATAGAVLEVDPGLRLLRFKLVPRQVSEDQFWRRYFTAVAGLSREVAAGSAMRRVSIATSTADRATEAAASGASNATGNVVRHAQQASSGATTPGGPRLLASNLMKTLSQVGSLAEGLMSPRSLLSEQTGGHAAMSIGQPDPEHSTADVPASDAAMAESEAAAGDAVAHDETLQQRQHEGGCSRASAATSAGAGASARLQPQQSACPLADAGPALRGDSSSGAACASPQAEPAWPAAFRQAARGRAVLSAAWRPHDDAAPQQQGSGAAVRLRRFHWHTPAALVPSAALKADASPALLSTTAGDPAEQPKTQLLRQPSFAESDSSDWSHTSDQFQALSRELEAEDWMML